MRSEISVEVGSRKEENDWLRGRGGGEVGGKAVICNCW